MSIAGLLNQTITLYPKTGYDRYSREVVGEGTQYRARVELVNKRKMQPGGEVVVISAIAYLNGSVTIKAEDKLSYNGVNYSVFETSQAVDGSGRVHHTKVLLLLCP